tara:strand:+ start:313 stop:513 length:201 start_codon:yes stop_codon:yes gene_type:complete
MKITIKNREYDFTEEQLNYLKSHLRNYPLEYKNVGVEDVAISLGVTLLGYAQGRVIQEILTRFGKI